MYRRCKYTLTHPHVSAIYWPGNQQDHVIVRKILVWIDVVILIGGGAVINILQTISRQPRKTADIA